MSLTLNDLMKRYYEMVLPASLQADSPTTYTPGSMVPQVTNTDSVFASGRQVAPAAFTIIGQTGAVTGLYRVVGTAVFGGAAPADPTDTNNIRISVGGNAKIVLPIPPAISVPVTVEGIFRANAETIRIGSAGNVGTAGVIYIGTVVATKIAD